MMLNPVDLCPTRTQNSKFLELMSCCPVPGVLYCWQVIPKKGSSEARCPRVQRPGVRVGTWKTAAVTSELSVPVVCVFIRYLRSLGERPGPTSSLSLVADCSLHALESVSIMANKVLPALTLPASQLYHLPRDRLSLCSSYSVFSMYHIP